MSKYLLSRCIERSREVSFVVMTSSGHFTTHWPAGSFARKVGGRGGGGRAVPTLSVHYSLLNCNYTAIVIKTSLCL